MWCLDKREVTLVKIDFSCLSTALFLLVSIVMRFFLLVVFVDMVAKQVRRERLIGRKMSCGTVVSKMMIRHLGE